MYNFKIKLDPFARGFLNCESDSKSKRISSGFLSAANEPCISFDLDKGFVYTRIDGLLNFDFGTNLTLRWWELDRLNEENPGCADDIEYIREAIKPWVKNSNLEENCFTLEQNKHWWEGHLWGGTWMGHAVPDLTDIAMFGTDYYREKIAKYRKINPGKDDFYDSLLIMLDALDTYGENIRKKADEMLPELTDADEIRKLTAIRDTFDHAPKVPCRDFVEATVVYVWLTCIDAVDSPGRFDQYMYDFWKVTDPTLRREYLEAIWERFHETRTWNLCISGSDENWNDMSNDLTYEILDVTAKYKYQTPNLTMRCHRNTPEKLLRAAYKALATGCTLPALYNDEAVCPALERLGIPPEDSHNYCMNGCNQIDIQGRSHMGLEDGEVLIAKAVEFVLFDGVSPKSGNQLGLHTGDPTELATYDDFYDAFIKQLDYITDVTCDLSNTAQRFHAKESPNPIRSITIDGCIEKGLDYKASGPIYGHGQILAEGIADAADSLAAVKKYVYEDKKFTMAELVDALSKNFEGYDDMYHTLKNSELKFGNDIDYVDSIAAEVVDHFNKHLLSIPTVRGGYFSGGCSPFNRAARYGSCLCAMPNGKKKGESLLADSIGATPGFDSHGPTALLNSCLKFDHTLPGSGFILNVKFEKSLFASKSGEESFLALTESYFKRLGQMLTFTVISPDELLDAQKHPENHQDLIVRVGGYSDYFVNLDEHLQENVISRTLLEI